mmetsp:Transcript_53696/g.136239  ORF Transcript_53696/g.136239 Transcript_53696/m.136239 type:complete len:346 (-) Transcript_53696:90-1127(-)
MQRRVAVVASASAAGQEFAGGGEEQGGVGHTGFGCWRRRSTQAKRNLPERAVGVLVSCILAASRAVGAAGGGWALVAAVRAGADAVGLTGSTNSKAKDESSPSARGAAADAEDGPVPQHVAVIMDGNRRFGCREHGNALSGHRAGGEKLRDFLEWCVEEGIRYLTVFAFSTENWKRDPAEVDGMMQLFMTEVPRLGKLTAKLNVRVRFLASDAAPLSAELRACLARLEEETAICTGCQLNVCMSYGGRGDVVHACQALAREVAAGTLKPEEIDEDSIKRRLLTGDIPDPDVLIRTSGERRLSNFLMYQLAYSEMFFLDKHWPEVTREDLLSVISSYQQRQRRFGR